METMKLGKKISEILQKDLDAGLDNVRPSNLAFVLSQDYSLEISDEIYDLLFDLILIQERYEFEMNEFEIRSLIKKLQICRNANI